MDAFSIAQLVVPAAIVILVLWDVSDRLRQAREVMPKRQVIEGSAALEGKGGLAATGTVTYTAGGIIVDRRQSLEDKIRALQLAVTKGDDETRQATDARFGEIRAELADEKDRGERLRVLIFKAIRPSWKIWVIAGLGIVEVVLAATAP